MAGEGAPTWEEVARSHGRFLYTVAYRLTGNREDAEDYGANSILIHFIHLCRKLADLERLALHLRK